MMPTVLRYGKWAFWNLAYLVYRPENTMHGWVTKAIRTRKPWWKFRPCVYRNADGKEWEITLGDERCCTHIRQKIELDVGVGFDSGKIVSLDIPDESLRALELKLAKT